MTATADSLIHSYLVSVSAKLANQFKKKCPSNEVWTGPGLIQLIDFYKRNFREDQENDAVKQKDGKANVHIPDNSIGKMLKKGKKRKLDEMIEESKPVVLLEHTTMTEKKIKKKKNKKSIENIQTIETVIKEPETSTNSKKKKKKKKNVQTMETVTKEPEVVAVVAEHVEEKIEQATVPAGGLVASQSKKKTLGDSREWGRVATEKLKDVKTDSTLPSYIDNRVAKRLAAEREKRKLLWGGPKKESEGSTKNTVWGAGSLKNDLTGEQNAKFLKLMGVKNVTADNIKNYKAADERVQRSTDAVNTMESEYEKSRYMHHVTKGVGLGAPPKKKKGEIDINKMGANSVKFDSDSD